MNNAIKKLQIEIDENKNNPAIAYTGDFLIKHIESNPAAAEKILAVDKTIAKSINEIRKVAEKRRSGNCAVIAPDEGLKIVLKYFDIDEDSVRSPEAKTTAELVSLPVPEPTESAFDISLEDLL